MKIIITKKQAAKIGFEKFAPFGFNERSWGWRDGTKVTIDLNSIEAHKVDQLDALLESAPGVYGAGSLRKDIAIWKAAVSSDVGATVKSLVAFEVMLREFMRTVPGHRVFKRGEGKLKAYWHCYVVDDIAYHKGYWYKSHYEGKRWVPPKVTCNLDYDHGLKGVQSEHKTWSEAAVVGMTVEEILRNSNIVAETAELRAAYTQETEKFKKWFRSIGKQLIANGDGDFESTNADSWWRKQTISFGLVNERVVIDVKSEGSKEEAEDDGEDEDAYESAMWKHKVVNEETSEEEEVSEPLELPVHPYLRVFVLRKHMQMTLHISALSRYKYDKKMIKRLVIDEQRKALVKLLMNHKASSYKDIIQAKAGGAVVLLCGPPGVGKTLTAEVFAESEKRALYSVQCSQLGVTPEELEDELLKVLSRAARWKAVLLLDEADVYIRQRGQDVNQNAMVGVFLRVLEYQNAVMFMTTNRPQDVDDAVSSRCVAKLMYKKPSVAELVKIWNVLTRTAGVKLDANETLRIANAHSDCSGRDVKQLLKLAMLVTPAGKPITKATIDFVKQFKSA